MILGCRCVERDENAHADGSPSSSHGTSDTPAAERSKLEKELEDTVENGFELRKGIGLRFQRAHAPNTAKHAEYKALKSHQKKAQFRRDWASQELRNLKQKKNAADRELGEYVCSGAMVEKFGYSDDPKGATQRANVHAGKCDKMGSSWVSWNDMVNEKGYFYLRRQHETVFAEKWALFSAESQESEFLDEEDNAVPPRSKRKAKATCTHYLLQHTRVPHMRAAGGGVWVWAGGPGSNRSPLLPKPQTSLRFWGRGGGGRRQLPPSSQTPNEFEFFFLERKGGVVVTPPQTGNWFRVWVCLPPSSQLTNKNKNSENFYRKLTRNRNN